MVAHTQKYYLRRASDDDTQSLYELLCIPDVYRYLMDGAPPPRSIIEQWIERSHADFSANGLGSWMLHYNERQIAGCVRLEMQNQPRSAELTYLLHPQFWGHGLATRMSWTVMQRAFDEGRVDQIIAGVDKPNTASVAVMRRLGMTFLRSVQYPLGPGAEYVYRYHDPAPIPLPAAIAFYSNDI